MLMPGPPPILGARDVLHVQGGAGGISDITAIVFNTEFGVFVFDI